MKTLEDVLNRYVSERYGIDLSGRGLHDISDTAKRLSDYFTRERGLLPKDYLSDTNIRAVYLTHFTLTNAAKVIHCLDEMAGQLNLAIYNDRPLRILDLGCGPGAGIHASSIFFRQRYPRLRVEMTGVDQNAEILMDSKEIFGKIKNPNHSYHYICERIRAKRLKNFLGRARFDIVIAANLLSELEGEFEPHHLCKEVVENHLTPRTNGILRSAQNDTPLENGGVFILIEPALRETTRMLMHVRDHLIETKKAEVLAPCLHQHDCPMLKENDRDWCHFYIEWNRPELISKMDSIVGTDHTYLKMSYAILSSDGCVSAARNVECQAVASGSVISDDRRKRMTFPVAHTINDYRVISSPLVSKGKTELALCGNDGSLRRVRRLDRDASDENQDFARAKRGDIVSSNQDKRIKKGDSFRIVKVWKN